MHSYAAFGLGISSELKLPELVRAEAGSDVVIRRGGPLKGAVPFVGVHGQWTTDEGTHICWDDVGTLSVRDGNEIVVRAVRNAEERRLRMLLLGAAMGVLLHQRGVLVLHGSAIEVDGEACVFIGQRGWGKSTIAAGMIEGGDRLIADDVVAIDFDADGAPTVQPAFPQLKLWPDAIVASGQDPGRLRRLSSGFDKRERRVRAGFRTSPVRLKHVFVLAVGPCVEVEATHGLALVVALPAVLLWRRRPQPSATRVYLRLRKLAHRRGLVVEPSTAAGTLRARLVRRFPAAAHPAEEIVGGYLRESYGGAELSADEVKNLEQQLAEASRSLRRAS